MAKLNWINCVSPDGSPSPCPFLTTDLNDKALNVSGVYMIWAMPKNPAIKPSIIRIGRGLVSEQLKKHRWEKEILEHVPKDLYITWAGTSAKEAAGIERFLTEKYAPLLKGEENAVDPIEVNPHPYLAY